MTINTERYTYLMKCEHVVRRLGIDPETFCRALAVAAYAKAARRAARHAVHQHGQDHTPEQCRAATEAEFEKILADMAGVIDEACPEPEPAIEVGPYGAPRVGAIEMPPYRELPDWMRESLRTGRLQPRHHERTGEITCYTTGTPPAPADRKATQGP